MGAAHYDGSAKLFQIGVRPIDPAEWIVVDQRLPAYLAEKARLLAERRDEVFAAESDTTEAQAEVLALLADHLPRQFPGLYRHAGDAMVVDAVRDLAWATDKRTGARKLAPEGLYGRRKMTALVRRRRLPDASAGAWTGRWGCLACPACAVTRASGPRSRPRTVNVPGIYLTATSPHRLRTACGSPTSPNGRADTSVATGQGPLRFH